jgi:hypothetical protein
MNITFVKKVLKDGRPCQKCLDVEQRLKAAGQMDHIDTVLVADERDPDSAGIQLANKLGVSRAPFFVVDEGGETKIYTVYFKFAKEVFGNKQTKAAESQEILNDNPDLDFI